MDREKVFIAQVDKKKKKKDKKNRKKVEVILPRAFTFNLTLVPNIPFALTRFFFLKISWKNKV